MNFLSLIASLTQKAVVTSEQILDQFAIPSFVLNDTFDGMVTVVSETGDPTDPVSDVAIDSSSGIALTDGKEAVYAVADVAAVTNGNEINFSMAVNSDALQAALAATTEDAIPAFLEVRIVKDEQNVLLLREPCVIQKAGTAQPLPPVTTPGLWLPPITVGADYHVTTRNFQIMADPSTGSFTIFLRPAIASGQMLHITRMPHDDNVITILPDGSDTIQDALQIALTDDWSDVWLIDSATGLWDSPS